MILIAMLQVAQQLPAPTPALPSDDIVVASLRDIDDPGSTVTSATLGSNKIGRGATQSRRAFDLAERFARCAVVAKPRAAADLRGALDGTINSARQAFQQNRFVQLNAPCAADTVVARTYGVATVWDGYPGSYYDRGAMFAQALRVYAPDLKLTRQQTGDRAVQIRFNSRETPLARFRLAADTAYFETAICIVRLRPELATRLIGTTDYQSVRRLEAAMVNGARECTGGARRVYFDPMQFRFYIADAVYRWAVAVKGVDSLIPAED